MGIVIRGKYPTGNLPRGGCVSCKHGHCRRARQSHGNRGLVHAQFPVNTIALYESEIRGGFAGPPPPPTGYPNEQASNCRSPNAVVLIEPVTLTC
jgi:hypothetical protein